MTGFSDLGPLLHVAHRPYPLPDGPWRMRQRWNDLLFAHWPVAPAQVAALLPAGLEVDTCDGEAWVGVVPFWMDQVRTRLVGELTAAVPTTSTFSELNLRTYVRSARNGKRGVFFFSLDCTSLLAVLGARVLFHLAYFPAAIERGEREGRIEYTSRRLAGRMRPRLEMAYAPVGGVRLSEPGSLEAFLTERYCLFTAHRGKILRGEIHHLPWPLQPAEAEIRRNELPAAHGLGLPETPPVLHFSRRLEVYVWGLCADG